MFLYYTQWFQLHEVGENPFYFHHGFSGALSLLLLPSVSVTWSLGKSFLRSSWLLWGSLSSSSISFSYMNLGKSFLLSSWLHWGSLSSSYISLSYMKLEGRPFCFHHGFSRALSLLLPSVSVTWSWEEDLSGFIMASLVLSLFFFHQFWKKSKLYVTQRFCTEKWVNYSFCLICFNLRISI